MDATAINAAAIEMTAGEIALEATRLHAAVAERYASGWGGISFNPPRGWSPVIYDDGCRSLCNEFFLTPQEAFEAAWGALQQETGARPTIEALAATLGCEAPR